MTTHTRGLVLRGVVAACPESVYSTRFKVAQASPFGGHNCVCSMLP